MLKGYILMSLGLFFLIVIIEKGIEAVIYAHYLYKKEEIEMVLIDGINKELKSPVYELTTSMR